MHIEWKTCPHGKQRTRDGPCSESRQMTLSIHQDELPVSGLVLCLRQTLMIYENVPHKTGARPGQAALAFLRVQLELAVRLWRRHAVEVLDPKRRGPLDVVDHGPGARQPALLRQLVYHLLLLFLISLVTYHTGSTAKRHTTARLPPMRPITYPGEGAGEVPSPPAPVPSLPSSSIMLDHGPNLSFLCESCHASSPPCPPGYVPHICEGLQPRNLLGTTETHQIIR